MVPNDMEPYLWVPLLALDRSGSRLALSWEVQENLPKKPQDDSLLLECLRYSSPLLLCLLHAPTMRHGPSL
ncbi:hypothetical protein Tco_0350004, partial [Tanacetum coccineum]